LAVSLDGTDVMMPPPQVAMHATNTNLESLQSAHAMLVEKPPPPHPSQLLRVMMPSGQGTLQTHFSGSQASRLPKPQVTTHEATMVMRQQ
jgi:hypothetical protein